MTLMWCLATAVTPTPETPVFQTTQTAWIDRARVPVTILAPFESDTLLIGVGEPQVEFMTEADDRPAIISIRCSIGAQSCSQTLYAAAQRQGFGPSAVVSFTATITLNLNVSPPAFSPPESTFPGVAIITLTSTSTAESAVRRYVIDSATPPNINSIIYTAPIVISSVGTHTIQAIETVTTNILTNVSSISSKTFIVEAIAPLQAPTISMPSGIYAPSLTATASCPDARASPFASSDGGVTFLAWATPVTFSGGSVELNAISERTYNIQVVCRAVGLLDSPATSVTYIVRTHVVPAVPSISPASGSYTTNALSITITCPTTGCSIFYTIDSSAPAVTFSASGGVALSAGSTALLYAGPISLAPGMSQVSAIAVVGDWYSTTVFSRYDVVGTLSAPELSPPANTVGETQVQVVVASQESANVWYVLRPDGDTTPIPPFGSANEWTMLPTGTSTIDILQSSTVHIQLSKQSYEIPPLTTARYIISKPTVVTFSQANDSSNLLWLLMLLLIIPIAGVAIAIVVYVRRERRKKIEKETFAQLGFMINDE